MGDLSSSALFERLSNFSDSKASSDTRIRPSERLLLDIESYGFNMDELRSVLTTKGNQLIVSCAGSGKTTALIFKVHYDIKSGRATKVISVNGNSIRVPERIWVATL